MAAKKKTSNPESEVHLQITLLAPPAEVDFGIQQGKANDSTTVQRTRSNGGDLSFRIAVTVKNNREDGLPNFLGPFAQGPTTERFVYIGVGTAAGQMDSPWQRRIKVPLAGISWELIEQAAADSKMVLEARLPGKGKYGTPSCATIRPLDGWKCVREGK